MSSETGENVVQNDVVDVDDLSGKDGENLAKNCDSGIETSDSSLVTLPTLPTREVSSPELNGNQVLNDFNNVTENSMNIEGSYNISSTSSISPDYNEATDDSVNFDELSLRKIDFTTTETEANSETIYKINFKEKPDDLNNTDAIKNTQSLLSDLDHESQSNEVKFQDKSINFKVKQDVITNIDVLENAQSPLSNLNHESQSNEVNFQNKNIDVKEKANELTNIDALKNIQSPITDLQSNEIKFQDKSIIFEVELDELTNIDVLENIRSPLSDINNDLLRKEVKSQDKSINFEVKRDEMTNIAVINNTQSPLSDFKHDLQSKEVKSQDSIDIEEKLDKLTNIDALGNTQSLITDINNDLQSKEVKSQDESINFEAKHDKQINIDVIENKQSSANDLNLNSNSKEDKNQDINTKLVEKPHDLIKIDDIDQTQSINDFNQNLQSHVIAEKSNLENTSKNLTTSTISLDEQIKTNTTILKPSYSRSAENISVLEHGNTTKELNSSFKDLNKDKILNEFVNQKTKAAATQKITPETPKHEPLQNNDAKYARLPKELLPQDLGSLVKNVHGIFSSVSGSLKYAYNQTQKVPKPLIKNVPRPIANGKLMDDIFEDDLTKANVPGIQNGVEKLEKSLVNNAQLEKEDNLNLERKETEDDCKKDVYKLQIESLEKALTEQRKENAILRERVKQQIDDLQERDQTFKELETKVDLMTKRVEQAEREKDAAVMRYASVECAAIEAKRAAEKAALAEKAAHTEMELMNTKLKSAHAEKQRICQLYDDKCHELSTSDRELAKVREDIKELEGRLKWTQSKLRMEMDAYKESSERADKLSQQVAELEAAKDSAATNATDSARAKQLEQELKESQAALILCRHEKQDLERRLTSASQQWDSCKRERDAAASNLAIATAEVERLKDCNFRLEEEAAELAALRAQAALADTLSAQLQRESERALQAEDALSRERARAETCARREAAALQHAASLTAQHVQQRASTNDREHKAQALEVENESLRERITALEHETARLQAALSEESDKRSKETRALARKVAEITEEAAEANKKLEWEKGENGVLKKKHANAIKELNRELNRALRRCEQLEAKLPPPEPAGNRTGSVSSLSSGESAPAHIEESNVQNGHTDSLPDIQVREPDRQTLIERIVSLQRAAARRAERCEFLEEHARQLTGELRGKARLLRHLLCSLPAGAVASSHSDAHKKEIARLGGGAMAAVWGGDSTGMTLELSLEMNTKLQAVLEDALLKNITLKENMDTLGEEIARLKGQMTANDNKT